MNHVSPTGRLSASEPAMQYLPRHRSPEEQVRFNALREALRRMAYPEYYRCRDLGRQHDSAKLTLGNPGRNAANWDSGFSEFLNYANLDMLCGGALHKSTVALAVDQLAPRPAQMPELPPVIYQLGDMFDLN